MKKETAEATAKEIGDAGGDARAFGADVSKAKDAEAMVRFAEVFRNAMYDLRFPRATSMAYLVVASAVTLAVGMWVFSKLEPRLAEEL